MGLSMAADCVTKVRSFGKWAAANCAASSSANAGQYASSQYRPASGGI